jgi:hypothetical protein
MGSALSVLAIFCRHKIGSHTSGPIPFLLFARSVLPFQKNGVSVFCHIVVSYFIYAWLDGMSFNLIKCVRMQIWGLCGVVVMLLLVRDVCSGFSNPKKLADVCRCVGKLKPF